MISILALQDTMADLAKAATAREPGTRVVGWVLPTAVLYAAAIWPVVGNKWALVRDKLATRAVILGVLYVTLVVLQVVQHFLATQGGAYLNGHLASFGSAPLFPANIIILLYLYLVRGAIAYRQVCFFILVTNVVMVCAACTIRSVPTLSLLLAEWEPLWSTRSVYQILFGTALLLFEAGMIVVIPKALYGIINRFNSSLGVKIEKNLVFSILSVVLITMIFDSIAFSFALLDHGRSYSTVVFSQLYCKLVAGSIYAGVLWVVLATSNDDWTSASRIRPWSFLFPSILELGSFFRTDRVPSCFMGYNDDRLAISALTRKPVPVNEVGGNEREIMDDPNHIKARLARRERADAYLRDHLHEIEMKFPNHWLAVNEDGVFLHGSSEAELLEALLSSNAEAGTYLVTATAQTIEAKGDIVRVDRPVLAKNNSGVGFWRYNAYSKLAEDYDELLRAYPGKWVAYSERGLERVLDDTFDHEAETKDRKIVLNRIERPNRPSLDR